MQKVFGNLVLQFKEFYKSMPPIKRNSIMLASAIALVGVTVVAMMMGKTNFVPLFRNVAPDQLALIVNNLQKKNIPFQLENDGSTIMIPNSLLHSTQMVLMSELSGTDAGSVAEVFAKQDFGVTSYAQKINYQRALQGELMRSINTLSAVKQSKVLLALPSKKTFLEEGGQPKASVVIELHPGKNLNQEQVRGITNLVSSSVENLDQEMVTVVDSRGKVLSKNYGNTAASNELLDIKRKREQEIEEKIEFMLGRVVGQGKVIARVDVVLNPKESQSVQESVDPDRTAVRSSVTEEEKLNGSRTNPTGVPGARSNIPGANDAGRVGFNQDVTKELKTTNYEVPKTVTRIKEAAGQLERVSVAVLVDGILQQVPGADGAEPTTEYVDRTPAEMAKYENIVKNVVGFNTKRGDSLRIENIQFQKEDFSESDQLLTSLERKKLLHSLFKWALLGFSLAMFFFIVVRPFMRWVTDSFQDSVEDMLPRTIEELEDLQSVDSTLPGMSGALPVLEESIDPNKAESELLKERIMAIIEQDIEKTSAAFSAMGPKER